jgi:hypothetical protein
MRSRELLLALALGLAAPVAGANTELSPQEIRQAAERVRSHPDLGGTRKETTLRFKKTEDTKRPSDDGQFAWLVRLAKWLSESARALMWLAGLVAVAVLLVGLRRWLKVRAEAGLALPPRPERVQSLDIRPESLPADIGAAAQALWQRGEQRAALSLLYRGALSRLVHHYLVPIRAASTEGECVALARTRLAPASHAFLAQLVSAWQMAVYGARMPDSRVALALCGEFDGRLPARPPDGGPP